MSPRRLVLLVINSNDFYMTMAQFEAIYQLKSRRLLVKYIRHTGASRWLDDAPGATEIQVTLLIWGGPRLRMDQLSGIALGVVVRGIVMFED